MFWLDVLSFLEFAVYFEGKNPQILAMGMIKVAHMGMGSAFMILTLTVREILVHVAMGIDL
jgi:hypothetical protein